MRVLVGLVGVLVFVTSAHAECAWVLWVDDWPGPGRRTTIPTGAFERSTDCRKIAREEAIRMHNPIYGPMQEIRGTFHTLQGDSKDSIGATTIFQCLPDSVDPRGPKGK